MNGERVKPLIRFLIIAGLALLVAHLLDRWFYDFFVDRSKVRSSGRIPDWRQLFRAVGYVPTWWLISLAVLLASDDPARQRRKLTYLSTTPVVGVLVAEIAKFLFRRERPIDHDGNYFFRAFDGELTTSGLAFPSSHSLVAFAAAGALSKLYPRGWPLWWLLAAGCGLSRIAYRHHFLSDVTLAAILGWVVARVMARRFFEPTR